MEDLASNSDLPMNFENLYGPRRNQSFTSVICYPVAQITSNGVWLGYNPTFYTLPLTLLQLVVMIILSRFLHILLKPLSMPSVLSDILAGVLMGPSVLGQIKWMYRLFFPVSSVVTVRTLSWLGAIYYLFLMGVKMDVSMLAKGGKPAGIALSGIVLSTVGGGLVILPLKHYTYNTMACGPFLAVFLAIQSMSAFPVIYNLLAEFRLLSSEVGRLSMSVATINEVLNWAAIILLECVRSTGHFEMKPLFIQLASTVFVVGLAVLVVRPAAIWIIRRTPEGRGVDSSHAVAILLAVLVMSLVCSAMGLSTVEGAMILGIVIPDGPPLGSMLSEKIETVINNLMLPLFYINSAQRMDLWAVTDWAAVGAVFLTICVCRIGKLVGTVLAAVSWTMPLKDAFALGLVLCSKGISEMLTYLIWANAKALDTQTSTILVLSLILNTILVSPLVKMLSNSSRPTIARSRFTIEHAQPLTELRVVTCIHRQEDIPAILVLLDATSSSVHNPTCIYAMHLVDIVGRASPLLVTHKPQNDPTHKSANSIFSAFRSFERCFDYRVPVQLVTAVAPFVSMHKDVFQIAMERKASLILLPFHKRPSVDGRLNNIDSGLHVMTPNILREAPCSVGIVVDRGNVGGRFACSLLGTCPYCVGLIFLGGPDDREALSYASRMTDHPHVTLTVWRFVFKVRGSEDCWAMADDEVVADFRTKSAGNGQVIYRERELEDGEELLNVMRNTNDVYDMIVVGRHQVGMNAELLEGLSLWSENPELGPLGDLCSSSYFFGSKATILVMQQQHNITSHAASIH
ncbi:hypothetical protein ACLOJK_031425 [Asimina triloba]